MARQATKKTTPRKRRRPAVYLADIRDQFDEPRDVTTGRPEGRVSLDDQPNAVRWAAKEFGPRRTVGFLFGLIVLVYVLVVTVTVVIYGGWCGPPALNAGSIDMQSVATYKELQGEWNAHVLEVLKLLVKDTALPVLTLILGYVFGHKQSEASQPSDVQ